MPKEIRKIMPQLKIHSTYESALQLIKGGHIHDALTQLKVVLKENVYSFPDIINLLYKQLIFNPTHYPLRLLIAELYFYTNRYAEAIDELEELIELNPFSTSSFALLQKIYHQNQSPQRIKKMFENAFLMKNYDLVVIDFLQYIYFHENDLENSLVFYQKLIDLNPNNIIYHKNLLEILTKHHAFDQAFIICKKILELSPFDKAQISQKIEELLQSVPYQFEARKDLIRLYLQQYIPEKALEHLQTMITFHPNQHETIISLYKEALQLFPEMPELLIALSQLLVTLNAYSESVSYLRIAFEKSKQDIDRMVDILESILEVCPDQILALLLLADIFYEKCDFKKSLEYIDPLTEIDLQELDLLEEKVLRCIRYEGVDDYAKILLAKIEISRQDYEKALSILDQLLNKESDFPARILKAKIFIQTQDYSHALQTLYSALDFYPFHPEIHQILKNLQDRQVINEIDAHLRNLELQKDSPQKEMKSFELALLFLRSGDIAKALHYFQPLVSHSQIGDQVQILIGRCFMELSRYDLAINHLKRVLERLQQNNIHMSNHVRYLLSINYILLGKIEQATDYLDSILEYDINFPQIKEIVTYYKQHSFVDLKGKCISGCIHSVQHKEVAIFTILEHEIAPIEQIKADYISLSFSYTHNNKGVDNFLKENFKAAEDEFLLAIQMDPELCICHCNLAILYAVQKQYDRALSHLKKAEEIKPDYDAIYLGYGLLMMIQKEYHHSISYFSKAIRLNPKNYLACLNMGDIFYAQGDLEQAFSFWQRASHALSLAFLIQRRISYLYPKPVTADYWIYNLQENIYTLTPWFHVE